VRLIRRPALPVAGAVVFSRGDVRQRRPLRLCRTKRIRSTEGVAGRLLYWNGIVDVSVPCGRGR
jgi:hypothetical protein